VENEKNELVRKILQVCAGCAHGQGKGRGLVCEQNPGKCHSKRVRRWLKQIEQLEELGKKSKKQEVKKWRKK
jgi:putative lipoic acid-binding regulatory protein